MTNPNNAIGTNGAFSGRTSPNALNDVLASFTGGIVSGWVCSPKTGMTVQLGGSASTRDVALAEDNAGNKLTIDNRSGAPVEITLDGAPSTNNRIDAIVAYVDNPSTGDDNTTDNPSACGIITVKGTVAANPSAPSEAQIRSAITTDGATGGVAYYVVLATILVGTNVTTIGSGVITQGAIAQVETAQNQAATDAQTTADAANTLATALASFVNINTFNTYNTTSQFTRLSGSGTCSSANITVATNADKSLAKIYGTLYITSTGSGDTKWRLNVDTGLRPTSAINVKGILYLCPVSGSNIGNTGTVTINTNGTIEFASYNNGSSAVEFYLWACVLWIKDFGDA